MGQVLVRPMAKSVICLTRPQGSLRRWHSATFALLLTTTYWILFIRAVMSLNWRSRLWRDCSRSITLFFHCFWCSYIPLISSFKRLSLSARFLSRSSLIIWFHSSWSPMLKRYAMRAALRDCNEDNAWELSQFPLVSSVSFLFVSI